MTDPTPPSAELLLSHDDVLRLRLQVLAGMENKSVLRLVTDAIELAEKTIRLRRTPPPQVEPPPTYEWRTDDSDEGVAGEVGGAAMTSDLTDLNAALVAENAALRRRVEELERSVRPWYGPCDGFASGKCAECEKVATWKWPSDTAEVTLPAAVLYRTESALRTAVEALRDARPVVYNAVCDAIAETSPWKREVREKILATVDAALATIGDAAGGEEGSGE